MESGPPPPARPGMHILIFPLIFALLFPIFFVLKLDLDQMLAPQAVQDSFCSSSCQCYTNFSRKTVNIGLLSSILWFLVPRKLFAFQHGKLVSNLRLANIFQSLKLWLLPLRRMIRAGCHWAVTVQVLKSKMVYMPVKIEYAIL